MKTVDKIFHISDVHIRNARRHEEYLNVFNNLYTEIQSRKTENSVIAVTGDIAHSKTDMSPELVDMISKFLIKLDSLCHTVVIAGNHDCNLNNSNRLDVLSPIIEGLDLNNLAYLKHSGKYNYRNIDFYTWSVFDDVSEYEINPESNNIKIGLYHGAVDSAQTDAGFKITSKVNIDMMSQYDYFLLGDIHSHQYLNDQKTIGYAGSLVQQNHGESIDGHGMIVWDVNNCTSEFVEIKNEYGFFTLDVKDGKIVTDLSKFPKKCNLRIRTNDSKETDIKIIISRLKKNYDIIDYTVVTNNAHVLNETAEINNFYLDELNTVHHQNNIIKKYIKNTFLNIKKSTLNNVLKINENLNAQLSPADKASNIKWSPVHFKFSNMFSYGESNDIDFTSLNGIYGLFAPNAAGKSSVFDAISFCLFDKCSRTFKAEEVLNNQKNEFTSEFCFLFEDKKYYVERNAKRQKAGNVKVYVEFYTYENNTKVSLNGEHRRDTNAIIRQYLGSYEDFVFTSLSIQGNNSVFINKSQSERKDLLAQIMGLDIFDSLANLASDEIKETKALLNNFKKNDFTSELATLTQTLDTTKSELTELEKHELKYSNEITEYDNKIESQLLNLYDVDDTLSEQKLLSEINEIKKTIHSSETKKQKIENEIHKLYKEESFVSDQLNELGNIQSEFESFLIKENEYNEHIKSKSKLESKIEQLRDAIKRTKENLDFDVNDQCTSCLSNIKRFNEEYEKLLEDLNQQNSDLNILEQTINEFELDYSIKDNYDKYNNLSSQLNKVNQSIQVKESNTDVLSSQLNSLNSEKNHAEKKLKQLKQNEEKIQTNRQTKLRIQLLKDEKESVNKSLTKIRNEIKTAHSTIGYVENKISTIKQNINETKKLEKEYQAYELYLDCVKRDGIPYDIITKSIPKIQAEINNILKQIVEFSIAIDIDGKNINAKLVYEDKEWPLEMGSGMEKFICGVAIRIALMNVSKLPKPNFMVLDEGFGVLDSDNLNSVYSLFQYMKSYFKFIIVISHLDGMRDVVDNFIEISKADGYSKIHHR